MGDRYIFVDTDTFIIHPFAYLKEVADGFPVITKNLSEAQVFLSLADAEESPAYTHPYSPFVIYTKGRREQAIL